MQEFKIVIELLTEMLGTVPKDKEVYATYIASKKPDGMDPGEIESVEEIEKKGSTGFHRDENGIFVYDYMIKGFIKNAGNILKDELKVKALRSKISDYLFITPRKIYFGKKDADGILERPLRCQTMQGPRVSLARSEYVNAGSQLIFTIKLLNHKEITKELILELLKYGELQGLGQWRNGGHGSFKVVEVE